MIRQTGRQTDRRCRMSNDLKKILKRIVVLFAAIAVVGWIGLRGAEDRMLRANEMSYEDTLAEAPEDLASESTYAPSEETVELAIPQDETWEDSVIQDESAAETESAEEWLYDEAGVSLSDGEMMNAGSDAAELGENNSEGFPEVEAGSVSSVSGEIGASDAAAESGTSEVISESGKDEEDGKDQEPVLRVTAQDGAEIVVMDPEKTLPEGAYVTADILPSQIAAESIGSAIGSGREIAELVVYDIVIHGPDGEEIIPDSSVRISIRGMSVSGSDEAAVYHIEGDGNAEKVADVTAEGDAEFVAASN